MKNEHDAVSVKLESNLGIKSETSEMKSEVKREGSDKKFTLDMKIVENRGEPEKSPLNTFRDKLLMILREEVWSFYI